MSEEKIDDIDRPIELKQSKIASAIGRVGVSGKGLQIGALVGVAVIGAIAFGIMQAGPGDSNSAADTAGATDMPGQSQSYSVIKALAEADAKRATEASQELPPPPEGGGLQVRGAEQQPGGYGAGPNAQQLQTPAEQHKLWLEKKRYERIEGRILAADMALTSDMTKGTPGGGTRLGAAGDSADPLARLAGIRSAALGAVPPPEPGVPAIPPGLLGAMANANPASLQLGGDPNVAAQERNREFLKEAAESGYLAESVKKRLGGHELAAGSIIPAVMLTGINSDLPGVITAQVRQTVYDTFDESVRVIPQGSRLVGRYSSQIASGQERVLVAWDELIFPNGNRINLRGMSGVDGLGQSGFNDKVDNHFFRTWGSAFMVSLLGVGVQLSQPQNASYGTAPSAASQSASAAANSLSEAGSKVLEKNLNISPTLRIRPGYVFNIIVNKSVLLPAYRD